MFSDYPFLMAMALQIFEAFVGIFLIMSFSLNSRDFLALCERNLDDSCNFFVRGYLSLIWKDSTTHNMYDLALYVKEGFPFARNVSLETSLGFYLRFPLALLYLVSYFFFPLSITFFVSILCTYFDSIFFLYKWYTHVYYQHLWYKDYKNKRNL